METGRPLEAPEEQRRAPDQSCEGRLHQDGAGVGRTDVSIVRPVSSDVSIVEVIMRYDICSWIRDSGQTIFTAL